jgi:hypothetical protein
MGHHPMELNPASNTNSGTYSSSFLRRFSPGAYDYEGKEGSNESIRPTSPPTKKRLAPSHPHHCRPTVNAAKNDTLSAAHEPRCSGSCLTKFTICGTRSEA